MIVSDLKSLPTTIIDKLGTEVDVVLVSYPDQKPPRQQPSHGRTVQKFDDRREFSGPISTCKRGCLEARCH